MTPAACSQAAGYLDTFGATLLGGGEAPAGCASDYFERRASSLPLSVPCLQEMRVFPPFVPVYEIGSFAHMFYLNLLTYV